MTTKPTLGLGNSRDWLTPLRSDGTRAYQAPSGDNIVGCHTGHSAGLNIANPIPGYEYKWELWGGTGSALLIAQMQGYEIIRRGDPDYPASLARVVEPNHNAPTPMDTAYTHGDVVAMRIPSERLRQLREEEYRLSLGAMDGGTRAFIEAASPEEMALGRGRPTRFARSDMVTNIMQGDSIVEQHLPDGSVPREG
mgnify:CR=1 FL=1